LAGNQFIDGRVVVGVLAGMAVNAAIDNAFSPPTMKIAVRTSELECFPKGYRRILKLSAE
jgi:hypothetical protein